MLGGPRPQLSLSSDSSSEPRQMYFFSPTSPHRWEGGLLYGFCLGHAPCSPRKQGIRPSHLVPQLGQGAVQEWIPALQAQKRGETRPKRRDKERSQRGSSAGWASGMRRASPADMGRGSSEQERIDKEAERQRPEDDSAWLDHGGREEEWKPEPELRCRRPSLEKWLVQKTGLGQSMESAEWHTFSLDNQKT